MKSKTFFILLLIMSMLFPEIEVQAHPSQAKKSLVVFFSRKGKNYLNGDIVNLKVGNTEVVAMKIRALTDSDWFEIETVNTYPVGYYETTQVAQQELNEKVRPKLRRTLHHLNEYDVIYIGYPIWWGTMPMALLTFLESYDFSGKTIFPFCTHEGSSMGSSERDLKKACPDSTFLPGLAVLGSNVHESNKEIAQWLEKVQVGVYK